MIFSCSKYFLLFTILFVSIKLYEYLYVPWRVRQKYKNYKNVGMSEKFHPMLGDIALIVQNENNNKFRRQIFIDLGMQKPHLDFYIFQPGPITLFSLVSIQAFDEFEKLMPHKIDRHDHREFPFVDIVEGSFALNQSNEDWDERRKTIMKTIGINYASKFIPLMIQTVDKWLVGVKKNESINITIEMQKITFKIISIILFGSDIENMEPVLYQSPFDGSRKHLSFEEFFFALSKDIFDTYFSVKGRLFPILIKLNLIEPYKSNLVNKESFFKALNEFLSKSKDSDSVYRQVKDSGRFEQAGIIVDMISLLFAGFDTTSHGLCSMMYFLKKYPETMKKLKQNLQEQGIYQVDASQGSTLKDLYENCDYLNMVVKEGHRIDPPSSSTLAYFAKEDVEICGVKFGKGSLFEINSLWIHYNSQEWQKPNEFIPERFDPESEYFKKSHIESSANEARNPKSFIPFGFGLRNCAGQTLARLESKVLLSRIITNVEYEIDKELLESDYARFALLSNFDLKGKIVSK